MNEMNGGFTAEQKKYLERFATKDDLKSFATKDDLKSFATKDDLKSFATKDDLKSFATKDDLKSFATKDDLKAFATKDDLKTRASKSVADSLCIAVVKIQEDIRDIRATMATKKDIDRVLAAIDYLGRRQDRRLARLEAAL